ncbi:MAG: DUF4215 domain-containing protein [Kofleriaceae bacterium]
MRSRIAMAPRLPFLVALTALAACGDNQVPAGPDAGPDGPPECPTLAVARADFQFNAFNQLTGLRYRIEPGLGDARTPDYLLVELYDSTTEGLPTLAPGRFDLSAAPDNDLATCQHCVWLWQDYIDGGAPETVFYATAGSLVLDQVDDPFSSVFVGSTSELTIRAATLDPDTGRTSIIEGGACFTIAPLSFDTRPTPGRTCGSAEDCGNALLEICDPATATCGAPQCDDFSGCPSADQICISQYPNVFSGACNAVCDPTAANGCGAGEQCMQYGVPPTFGVCRRVGAGAPGETCAIQDISTSCVAGLYCDATSHSCLPTCSYFAADTGCTAGNACYVLGGCRPTSSGDPATIGQPCAPDAELAAGCASDGEAFRGICFSYDANLVCERACLGDAGCGAGEFCALRFDSGLGVCRPVPVCGDGERGEINEVCDDGNTTSGDGCSGDCQTVEYGALCGDADPLALDATTTGTTLGGVDGFQTSCQFGTARGRLWSVTPPSRGRLRFVLDSATRQTVALRETCEDTATEQGCSRSRNGSPAELIVQVTSANLGPMTAFVTAATLLEEGPFTLSAEFVAEQCGDGVTAGEEACDDGNTTGNDGCSADCRTIEYGALCALAPELSTTSPNIGDTTGGTGYFEASCSNSVYGSGPERLYRYTAPSAGKLQLRLEPDPTAPLLDLTLAVLDGCGASGTVPELGCSSVYDIEQVTVTLAAGQQILVLVEGFAADDLGSYTLTATFTP